MVSTEIRERIIAILEKQHYGNSQQTLEIKTDTKFTGIYAGRLYLHGSGTLDFIWDVHTNRSNGSNDQDCIEQVIFSSWNDKFSLNCVRWLSLNPPTEEISVPGWAA